jgi:hypothetical protein
MSKIIIGKYSNMKDIWTEVHMILNATMCPTPNAITDSTTMGDLQVEDYAKLSSKLGVTVTSSDLVVDVAKRMRGGAANDKDTKGISNTQ